ncbi:hypothetical protein ABT150_46435 [Streptomyces mirabilis]|uniref:hypothetical protein n=1 Tax=Streptomyces mirabilis TaxID=68239 RepID=UPI003317A1BF
MTSRLLMPYRRAGGDPVAPGTEPVPGSTRPTPILDWTHPNVTALVERIPTEDTACGAPRGR